MIGGVGGEWCLAGQPELEHRQRSWRVDPGVASDVKCLHLELGAVHVRMQLLQQALVWSDLVAKDDSVCV